MGSDALGETSPLKVRAFFGLPLPEEHRLRLEPFLARCAAAAPAFRWVPAGNLHLTIRFLGHVELGVAEAIAHSVEDARPEAFELELGGIGTFGRGRRARVVWLGLVAGSDPAQRLAATVEERCRLAGLEPETRPFNAHLTLARAKDREGAPLPDVGSAPELPAWRAGELILYRSETGRGGSAYSVLRTIALR